MELTPPRPLALPAGSSYQVTIKLDNDEVRRLSFAIRPKNTPSIVKFSYVPNNQVISLEALEQHNQPQRATKNPDVVNSTLRQMPRQSNAKQRSLLDF